MFDKKVVFPLLALAVIFFLLFSQSDSSSNEVQNNNSTQDTSTGSESNTDSNNEDNENSNNEDNEKSNYEFIVSLDPDKATPENIKRAQRIVGVEADGKWGGKTKAAIDSKIIRDIFV